MDIATNVKLKMDDQYSFSISQEVEKKGLVEVALVYRVVIDALKPATPKEDCISSCCYQRWCTERLCPFR